MKTAISIGSEETCIVHSAAITFGAVIAGVDVVDPPVDLDGLHGPLEVAARIGDHGGPPRIMWQEGQREESV